jgi:predicted metal-dependent phosphoesterase TrpH
MFVDLHAHTTASDGTFSPTRLVRAAQALHLTFLAVTDHDTIAGVAEARQAAAGTSVHVLPGVELSADGAPGKCHLLGLGIDADDARLCDTLAQLSQSRRERNALIVARLNALGVAITLDEIAAHAPVGANVGRPHIAAALVARGAVADTREAFMRYLADDATAFVEKDTLPPGEAAALIHHAGGLCFVAHPLSIRLGGHETLETRLRAYAEVGIDGIEAYYPLHSPAEEERLLRLAEKYDLLVSGGSDFHGANKPQIPLGIVRDGSPLPLARISWLEIPN